MNAFEKRGELGMLMEFSRKMAFGPSNALRLAVFLFVLGPGLSSCTSDEEKLAAHLERAKEYTERNELNKALIELRNVVQLDPKNDGAHYQLGEIYLKLKQEENAIKSFQEALSANPENTKAQLKMGQIFLIVKQTSAARKMAMAILEKAPKDLDALQLLAAVQVQEKNPDAAIRTLEKALEIDPVHFGSRLFMAQILFSKGELDKAEAAYLKARSVDPASPIPYVELTRLYGSQGRWDEAEATLKAMVETPGQKSRKWTDLAGFYEGRKQWILAEKAYREAVAAAPSDDVESLMNLASFYARIKSYDKSLEAMKRADQIKKDDPGILIQIARLHFSAKKYPEAEGIVDRILAKYKEHPQANFMKGRFYLMRKEYGSALERFDQVIKETPKEAEAHYFKALCLLSGGAKGGVSDQELMKVAAGYGEDTEAWERELAAQSLAQSLEIDPDFLPARILYIDLCLQTRNARLARKHLEIALKAAPNDRTIQTQAGRLRFLEGDFEGAEKVFKKIIEQNPDYPSAHVSLGLMYAYLSRPEDALKAFHAALSLDPGQLEPLNLIVGIRLKNKEYDRALKTCEEQARRSAGEPHKVARIEFLMGNVYRVKGEIESAKARYKEAIDRDPAFLPAHMALAAVFVEQKRSDLAISQYEAALTKNPNYVPAYMALGMVHEGMGDLEAAEKYYRKTLQIDKDFVPGANNLAFILADKGVQLNQAAELAERAKSRRPKDPIVLDTLGWVYYKQGRYAAAVDELEASIAINPKDAQTHYHLGWAYYELKKFDQARQYMRKALDIDPHFKEADKARSILGE